MPEELILASPSTLTALQYVHFGFAAEAIAKSREIGRSWMELLRVFTHKFYPRIHAALERLPHFLIAKGSFLPQDQSHMLSYSVTYIAHQLLPPWQRSFRHAVQRSVDDG